MFWEAVQEQALFLMQNPTIVLLVGVFLGIFITLGIKAHKIHYVVVALLVAFGLIYVFNLAGRGM